MSDQIVIKNARLHNLKNVTLSIPKNKLVVLTGLSGSGKSTLAFDILHKEGQRQYMESLGLLAYGMSKPPVDAIVGLSPTISLDQHLTNHSPRSTVGTVTEVYTYIRVLYARLGHRPCPACGGDVPPSFEAQDEDWDAGSDTEEEAIGLDETFPCPHCGAPIPEMVMAHFSFNKPAGACPACTGLGVTLQPKIDRLIDETKSLSGGAVLAWDDFYIQHNSGVLKAAGDYYGFAFDPDLPVESFDPAQRDLLLYGVTSPQFLQRFPAIAPPDTVRKGRFEGVVTNLLRRYAERANDAAYRARLSEFLVTQTCPDCGGARLRPESRAVTINGQNIIEVSHLSLEKLAAWLADLRTTLSAGNRLIAEVMLSELGERVHRLIEVGVGYLSLDRSSPTLSAGEAQRLRLAALLGSGLTGVLYVLDEPTIGLHQRDTRRLIGVLRRLRDLGNTVLVVEHDLEMMRSADWLIDIGPGAGKHGGQIVAAGTPDEVSNQPGTITGDFLAGRACLPLPAHRRTPNGKALVIREARQNNLRNLTVQLPLGLLVVVSGVSGSGKSSLMLDVLDRAARQHFYGATDEPGAHDSIEGWEHLDKIITIDQEHIGRIPRSNAATYSDAFTPIREAFAATPDAKERGMSARHFSFNVPGGRCERCQGSGTLAVKMQFLPDVEVRCPACKGRRFTRETLAVHYHGHDISQVLDLTVEEALELFQSVPAAAARLKVMVDVGLGYLQLGQPVTTLSGGEAQRVKLAKELGRRASGRTLYLLDEPTTGLHPADTARLLAVLQRLADAGNSVVVLEHNLDVVKTADWVIDLGPEGGVAGGELIAEGPPEHIAEVAESHTGKYLKSILVTELG